MIAGPELTGDDAARAAIKMHVEDDLTAAEIARLLGKSSSWINHILTGRSYRHITGGQVISKARQRNADRDAVIALGYAARKSQAEIGRQLGLTRAAVNAHIKKMKAEGRLSEPPDPVRDKLAALIAETIKWSVADEDTVTGRADSLYIDGVLDAREIAAAILAGYKLIEKHQS